MSETCDKSLPRLITNVLTTVATTQDVASTSDIQDPLAKRICFPIDTLLILAMVNAGLLVESNEKYGIELFGPARLNSSRQKKTGGYDASQFLIDWDNQKAICPERKESVYWYEHQTNERYSRSVVLIKFKVSDCLDCVSRHKCVRNSAGHARRLRLLARPMYEALEKTRKVLSTEDGRLEYQNRAGIEGTL